MIGNRFPWSRIGCLGLLGLLAVTITFSGIRSCMETHRMQEAARLVAADKARQREAALQEARTASDPAAIVAAYERILPPSAESSDKTRFGIALAMLADAEEDAVEAIELYQRAAPLAQLTEAQASRNAGLTEEVRLASRREHLATARAKLAGAKAIRAAPATAGSLYREALAELDAAREDGAPPGETSAMERQATAGQVQTECEMGTVLREETASKVQTSMWSDGIDATVTTSGKCKTTIRIDWGLWDNPTAYAFQNGEIPGVLWSAGFTKIRLDSWDRYWMISP